MDIRLSIVVDAIFPVIGFTVISLLDCSFQEFIYILYIIVYINQYNIRTVFGFDFLLFFPNLRLLIH